MTIGGIDYRYLAVDGFGGKRWQPTDVTFRKTVVERDMNSVRSVERNALLREPARGRAQASQRLDDQRETVGEVIAGPAVEPHPLTILAGNDAEAVLLDL